MTCGGASFFPLSTPAVKLVDGRVANRLNTLVHNLPHIQDWRRIGFSFILGKMTQLIHSG
jgi:hypothetical protein